jgi:deferrochelatase/peroxidase EfeB
LSSGTVLDVADIQPGVLSEAATVNQDMWGFDAFFDFKGESFGARRKSLKTLLELSVPEVTVTLALSAVGLSRLGVSGNLVSALNGPFVAGAPARANILHDPDPNGWELGLADPFDAVVLISAESADLVDGIDALKRYRDLLQHNFSNLRCQETFLTARRDEAFGFRDGVTNPVLSGSGQPLSDGNGVRIFGGWRELASGEIVCGYPDESEQLPGPTVTQEFTRNGTYLVWRKLEQHVDVFQKIVADVHNSQHNGKTGDPYCETCAATVIGRNQNGSPLNPVSGGNNGFDFNEPNTGAGGADVNSHIRRANPRGTKGFAPKSVDRHRIIRRGVRWREPEKETDQAKIRREGLVFRCFQSDIANGFEFIQRSWMNVGESFSEGRIPDVIVGQPEPDRTPPDPLQAERSMVWFDKELRDARKVSPTTTLASAYAFVPGLRTLRRLANSSKWMDPEVP